MRTERKTNRGSRTATWIAAALLVATTARAQESVTILFDGGGAEAGITTPGTRDFSFAGSTWSGGVVATERIPPLYASGSFSYEIDTVKGEVTFAEPVDSVEFFYVHGFGFDAGTATAFDSEGGEIASAGSNEATSFADAANFVTIDGAATIARVEFSGGVIDNFSFTTPAPLPPTPEPVPIPFGDLTLTLEPITGGLSSPIRLVDAGDGTGRLFIVDQTGVVRILSDNSLFDTPFLDVRDRMVEQNSFFDERGLLGLTFHPDYASNGRFFVRYSAPRAGDPSESCNDPDGFVVGCHKEVLAEFSVSADDPDIADPASERILFEVDEPEFNHDAGALAFGPDGYLYFSLGDGGGAHDGLAESPPAHGPIGNGQNIETPLGAILRIDVDSDVGGGAPFAIPPDNPFAGRDGHDAIYAYGLRNPFSFSFDRGGTHELFLADVGQNLIEEINVIVPGGNYGWAVREGSLCFDPFHPVNPPVDCREEGLIAPLAEYDHTNGLSAIGGFVYRGTRSPALVGKYVFGDWSREFTTPLGRLFYLDADGDRSQIFEFRLGEANEPLNRFVLGFGEDAAGEIYLLASSAGGPTNGTGEVFRLVVEGSAGGRLPGDCNGDGQLNVSDGVCVLNVLFGGAEEGFPCGDGLPGDPGNLGLLDWQNDESVNISDGIALLMFLFGGGPAHHLAVPGAETTACVPIAGCTPSAACP